MSNTKTIPAEKYPQGWFYRGREDISINADVFTEQVR